MKKVIFLVFFGFCMVCSAFGEQEYTIPYLNNTPGEWQSYIILNNTNESGINLSITLRDENGDIIGSKYTSTVSGKFKRMIVVDESIFGDAPDGGFSVTIEYTGDDITIVGAYVGLSESSANDFILVPALSESSISLVMPLMINLGTFKTYALVKNEGETAAEVTPVLHNSLGYREEFSAESIPGKGFKFIDQDSLFEVTDWLGWTEYNNYSNELNGMNIFYHHYSNKDYWGALTVPETSHFSQFVPYTKVDNTWHTYVLILNPTSETASVILSLSRPDGTFVGNPISMDITSLDLYTLDITDETFGEALGTDEEYMLNVRSSDGVIAYSFALNMLEETENNFIFSEALYQASQKVVVPHASSNDSFETYIKLYNPSHQFTTVTMTAYSDTGSVLSSASASIQSNIMLYKSLSEWFPDLDNDCWVQINSSPAIVLSQVIYKNTYDNHLFYGTIPLLPYGHSAIDKTVPTITASYGSDNYAEPFDVTLTMSDSGKMFYTTDGKIPTVKSTEYSAAITISEDTTLKVLPLNDYGIMGEVQTYNYNIMEGYTGMIIIPGGTFTMGIEDTDSEADERPPHTVTLNDYAIDRYEVTNTKYCEFLNAGDNDDHWETRMSITREFVNLTYLYTPVSGEENKPVTWVTWSDATSYARWAGKRLPTEAEWERAAAYTDQRKYPWGNTEPSTGVHCNYNSDRLTDVGSYESGKSAEGIYDLAGNVWEWCNDRYDENYYSTTDGDNPTGPVAGTNKVLRGGSYLSPVNEIRTTNRAYNVGNRHADYGFRCVRSVVSSDLQSVKKVKK